MRTRFLGVVATVFLFTGILAAGEKKLMHCFAFTPVESATESDWQAFYKATDQLPSKIPGVSKVWYGKLRNPLNAWGVDNEAFKKLNAGEPKATGEVTLRRRRYGVCMEMASEDTLKKYADDPFHKQWDEAYSKVRVEGTTTIDILGQ